MARDYMDDYMDGFGAGISDPSIAGPLIGGGAAQAASLATRLIWKDSKPGLAKWASAIGLGVGGGISAAMMFSPRFRQTGIAGLLTAALVSVPRQVEELLADSGTMKDYLGLITAEREMAGAFGDEYAMMGAGEAPDVQLLDSGSGSTGVLGTIVPEREMAGANLGAVGPEDGVELLGGFGSNFLSQQ